MAGKSCEYRKVLNPKSPSNLKEKDVARAIDKVIKVGRSACTGQFVPVKEVLKKSRTAVVETVRKSSPVRVVGGTIKRDVKSGKFVLVKEAVKSNKATRQKTSKKK